MPLTNRSRIVIADDEFDVVHGLVDSAAALAVDAFDTTELAKSAEALRTTLQHDPRFGQDISDSLTNLLCAGDDALRYAARLGYALARTVSASDTSWAVWVETAEAWLAGAGCEHESVYVKACAEEAESLRNKRVAS